MIIYLKNKHTLKIDDFYFKCSIGKNGLTTTKKEGDKKTPKGIFRLGNLYYRKDRLNLKNSKLKKIKIKPNMGWCDDINNPKNYNKLITKNSKIHHEKLYRKDHKYDLIIPIKYNFTKPEIKKGSCIFIHMTQNYKPTAGCIALNKNDLMIMLRLINKKTKIHIQ
jgi:L,D-peptidoglycan transpeptidase YkuD (ErfK/YbiS/YcfS/YnhG family)|tara:strand:- start:127 stop:621 length:495 start_codon:yes stop_codon:yes gene_type:complete